MRATLASVALAGLCCLSGQAAGSQRPRVPSTDYDALLHAYRSGDADAAIRQVGDLFEADIEAGFKAFTASPSAKLVSAVAALETEAAFKLRPGQSNTTMDRHVARAASIVEVGTPPKMKRLGSVDLKRSAIEPVSPEFRRLWFFAVITAMEHAGRPVRAEAYLENARLLFPNDAEFLLLSGIAQETRASPRVVDASEGDRKKALGHAEVYLRASMELAPERLETRLRLGRVLQQRGYPVEARTLLTALTDAPDVRIAYLASLFLGGIEDSGGNQAGAAQWYTRAGAIIPSAQAARLAASELQHRAGERQQAAAALPSAIGPNNSADPWWSYSFGEFWRLELFLNALRKMSRT
jgi:tetratricopeptide (TPR) repeat protein